MHILHRLPSAYLMLVYSHLSFLVRILLKILFLLFEDISFSKNKLYIQQIISKNQLMKLIYFQLENKQCLLKMT